MNIPAYFYLRKKKWTVILSEDKKWHLDRKKVVYRMVRDRDGRKKRKKRYLFRMGETDPNTRTITLWYALAPRKLRETFCHEYLHAFEFEYEIAIPHDTICQLEKPLVNIFLRMAKTKR